MPTVAAAWHQQRHARILAAHPEVRSLQGIDRRSQLWILLLVVGEFAAAAALQRTSWGIALLAAATVVPLLSHALGVQIHEATHNLVTRGSRANKLWILVANLPLLAPAGIEFRAQHLLHHKFLGEVDGRDTQAPTRAEVAWVGARWWRKLGSFTFGRFFYQARPANRVARDGWLLANWGLQLAVVALLGWFVGPKAVVVLAIAGLLAFGPHPVGARRLSEHFAVFGDQPTVSYYGALNPLSFNVGYHVEHHDFPAIPWSRLSQLRQAAADEYGGLFAFHSWSRLLLHYVFNSRLRVEHYAGFGEALCDGAKARCAATPARARRATASAAPHPREGAAGIEALPGHHPRTL